MSSDNVNTVGSTDWDEFSTENGSGGNYSRQRVSWLKFKPGKNYIRIFTKNPTKLRVHKVKISEKLTVYLPCSDPMGHKNCPLCEAKYPARDHAIVGALYRGSNKDGAGVAMPMEVKTGLIKEVQKVRQAVREMLEVDDVTSYDIEVKVTPGDPSSYYSASPSGKPKPLSAADRQAVDDFDAQILVDLCTPPTPEQLSNRLRKIMEKHGDASKTESGGEKSDKDMTTAGSAEAGDGEVPEFPVVGGPKFKQV